jgi:hypothetical protein
MKKRNKKKLNGNCKKRNDTQLGPYPLGFDSIDEFLLFSQEILSNTNTNGKTVLMMKGSSVTGHSFFSKKRFNKNSDFDIALISRSLFKKADNKGIEIRTNPVLHTMPLGNRGYSKLGTMDLVEMRDSASDVLNTKRPLHFMIFRNVHEAIQYSTPSLIVHVKKNRINDINSYSTQFIQ